ncbi:MAG: exopolyphosphatase / guanosine-5-triphosphate,3-diphosphate pyrophosphatase [Solirubrobacterales bacterium]|nr:exopolyphosphatase / guanosine-5-triphosphate,3-diphosphate pyrophosphatase [Solirubrobacterales bacterium]
MRVAVIDLGTNSTRLLVAGVENGQVTELERCNTVTRLGRGVDLSRQLCSDAIEDVCAVVGDYLAVLREMGAERVSALATSAVRDASNGGAFLAELRERFALDAQMLSGEEEARLTYLGAMASRDVADGELAKKTLVFDIGGGSTELVCGRGADVDFHASLQVGTVRHTERHLLTDPPRAAALDELATDVRGQIEKATSESRGAVADHGIAVAGTPTSLAAIDLELDPYDPEQVHGHRMSLQSIQRMFSRLAAMPLAERLKIPGLHPGRAPTIVAGVVILVETMRAFGLSEIEASEQDILWGSALATALAPV